jgi:hypothetical protein
MDVGVKVGERGPEDFVELSRTILIRRAPRLRRVVEKIVGEEFLEDREIPPCTSSVLRRTTAFAASLRLLIVMTLSSTCLLLARRLANWKGWMVDQDQDRLFGG